MNTEDNKLSTPAIILTVGVLVGLGFLIFSGVDKGSGQGYATENEYSLIEFDVNAVAPHYFKQIVQKIKRAPNSMVVSSFDTGLERIRIIYEIAKDPLDPSSGEALILEIQTTTYVGEDGTRLPSNREINDVFQFRDTDFDGFPNDYWSNDFEDMRSMTLSEDTPNIDNLLILWAFGMFHFKDNLL